MPRVIDLSQGNATDWDEVRLPEPVYGTREIREAEIDAIVRAYNKPILGFWPQFSSRGLGDAAKHQALKAAHTWLSEHTTGPWLWSESWSNHGHCLDTHVYVEREPDQKAFAAAHPDLFAFRANDEFELGGLAFERGVTAPLTTTESFSQWSDSMRGYEILPSDDLGKDGWRIVLTHPEIQARFAERWGQILTATEIDGRPGYEGVYRARDYRDSLAVWLDKQAGLTSIAGGPGEGGQYEWTVEARYPDVAEAILRDWGHVFQAKPNGTTFFTLAYPSAPTRTIPEDFAAYLRGEIESYETPFLPNTLKAFYATR